MTGREQPRFDAASLFLPPIDTAQAVAQLGAGHLVLEVGMGEHSRQELVLVKQNVFIEGHVGDADGALVA